MKTNRTSATLLALSILGAGVAGAQMTPPSQQLPPTSDKPQTPSTKPPVTDKAPAQSKMPEGKEIQGTIKSVDRAKQTMTLDDGTTLTIPNSVKVAPNALKKGAKVNATYEEKDGKRVVTSLRVEPASKS